MGVRSALLFAPAGARRHAPELDLSHSRNDQRASTLFRHPAARRTRPYCRRVLWSPADRGLRAIWYPAAQRILAEPASSAHRHVGSSTSRRSPIRAASFVRGLCLVARWKCSSGTGVSTPGLRVIRDAPVITSEKAVLRGRLLKLLAFGCGVASVAMALLLWRLAS